MGISRLADIYRLAPKNNIISPCNDAVVHRNSAIFAKAGQGKVSLIFTVKSYAAHTDTRASQVHVTCVSPAIDVNSGSLNSHITSMGSDCHIDRCAFQVGVPRITAARKGQTSPIATQNTIALKVSGIGEIGQSCCICSVCLQFLRNNIIFIYINICAY